MDLVSISAFSDVVNSGVTWRVDFINKKLAKEGNNIIKYFRGTKNKSRIQSQKKYLGSKNKYIHLFDPIIIIQIFCMRVPVLYCHTIWSVLYGIFFRIVGRQYIFDNHNVEFDRMWSTNRYLLACLIYLLEFLSIRLAKKTTTLSLSDKIRLHYLYGKNLIIEVVECTYELGGRAEKKIQRKDFFDQIGVDSKRKILLFFAAFDYNYFPNMEALQYIQTEIIPRMSEHYHIIIAGGGSEKYQSDSKVTYVGFYADLDELILQADLVIAPIFSGGGVKIKVVQTIGLNQNILTTKEGVRGIEFLDKKNVFVADGSNFLMSIVKFFGPVGES